MCGFSWPSHTVADHHLGVMLESYVLDTFFWRAFSVFTRQAVPLVIFIPSNRGHTHASRNNSGALKHHASCSSYTHTRPRRQLRSGMLRTSFRRSTRARLLRALFLLLTAILVIDLFSLLLTRQRRHHPVKAVPNVHGQRIYISSIHWNNEKILRSHWNDAVVELVKYFGPENVFVSIHESGSWDDTKGALRALDQRLGELQVQRDIALDDTTHADELKKPPTAGWIDTVRGRKELRRIPYLARLRNASMQSLRDLAARGMKFDKVLFLNDVVFKVRMPFIHPSTLPDHSTAQLTIIPTPRPTTSQLSSQHVTVTTPPPAPSTSHTPRPTTTPSPYVTPAATKPYWQHGPTSAPPILAAP